MNLYGKPYWRTETEREIRESHEHLTAAVLNHKEADDWRDLVIQALAFEMRAVSAAVSDLSHYVITSDDEAAVATRLRDIRQLSEIATAPTRASEVIKNVAVAEEGTRSMKSNDMSALTNRVVAWARDRKLTHPEHGSTPEKQYLKLGEEFGELGAALARGKHNETIDAIGDMVVVLTIMAELINWPIEDCLASVLEVIEKRRGEMRNGVFVKEEDL